MAPTTTTKAAPKKVGGKAAVKAPVQKFVVDFSVPANDKIFDGAAYEKFMIDHIKVEGKTGQLGEDVKVTREGPGLLAISSSIPFSKRYLKYLTKKFLKRNQLREWLRVIATNKSTYALRFYNVHADGAENEDEE